LERVNVTPPIAFVILGLVTTHPPLSILHLNLHSTTIRDVAELALALVLFADASRVDLGALRADLGLPVRLLGIGLPLTILTGAVVAALLLGSGQLWIAALVASIVAPTDAALGATIILDDRVPARVRRLLNVESGLNDGIATPFVNIFLAGAVSEEFVHASGPAHAVYSLITGTAIGAGMGLVGGWLLHQAEKRELTDAAFRPLAVLGLALGTYALAIQAGGNGFVAAFVAGMAFGSVTPHPTPAIGFTEDLGELLSLIVWYLFGAVLLVPGLRESSWRSWVFGLAALTIVRMGPVALSLIGSGLDRRSVAFIGWFGPRGLASVVFTLISVDSLAPADANKIIPAATIVVAGSVLAHGLTAGPLAVRYATAMASRGAGEPEHADSPELPARQMLARRERSG
jgi:NhaP-type Na+/H+ or K+/H+ antiporter